MKKLFLLLSITMYCVSPLIGMRKSGEKVIKKFKPQYIRETLINPTTGYPIKNIPYRQWDKNITGDGTLFKTPKVKGHRIKNSDFVQIKQEAKDIPEAEYTKIPVSTKRTWDKSFRTRGSNFGFFKAKAQNTERNFNRRVRKYSTQTNESGYFSGPDQTDLAERVNCWSDKNDRDNELKKVLNYFLDTLNTAYANGGSSQLDETYKWLEEKYRAPKPDVPDYTMYLWPADRDRVRNYFDQKHETNRKIEALIYEARVLFHKEQETKELNSYVEILQEAKDRGGNASLNDSLKDLLKRYAPGERITWYNGRKIDRSAVENRKSATRDLITKAYNMVKNNEK